MIPPLLMPEVLGDDSASWLAAMADPQRIGDTLHESHDCWRIQNTLPDHAVRTVWIDKKTRLIIRIDLQLGSGARATSHTTLFTPVINGDIPPMLLQFNAPK
jgi:hypothetical protein